ASDLPKIFPNRWLDGKVDNYEVFQKGLEKVADHIGVKIQPCRTDLGAAKGVFYPMENAIELNHRNSEVQNATTLIHELANAKLHSGMKVFNIETHEAEFQAEMVSYAVSAYFGLGGEDKEEKSLQYIYNWTKDQTLDNKEKLLKEVRAASV
ncbi:ImmA/IrrE family metallo-endopeptidase, partial [Klebsiella pneumoniae]|uniref:ImmA/IrrE family metallo-endopeptidase n=1 Tax=Klebsiella pneumoniae TaxID=573 RepID=UPI00101054A4